MDHIASYFNGEKRQYIIGVGLSIISIAMAALLFLQQTALFKGISYVVIPLSVILLSVCMVLIIRAPKDIKRVTAFQESASGKIQTEEIPRMEKVLRGFDFLKKAERALFVIGLILTIVLWENELVRGVGIGLAVMSVALYLFDHIAESRGERYLQFLQSL